MSIREELRWLLIMTGMLVAIRLGVTLPEMAESPWLLTGDDGRHFVVWLRQMADPALFQGDPIAHYFMSLTPAVYKALYFPAVWAGIDAVAWHLLLLSPLTVILFVIASFPFTTMLGFRGVERVLCIGVLTAVFMFDAALGLPRSFSFTILMGSLAAFYYRRVVILALIMLLGANLYPIGATMAGGAIALFTLARWVMARRIDRESFILVGAAGVSGIAGLMPFMLSTGSLGATLTLSEAKELAIFSHRGRTNFFWPDWTDMVLSSRRRSGILPIRLCRSPWLSVGFVIATFGIGGLIAWRRKLPRDALGLIAALCIVGVIGVAGSYAVAFKAHLPARYRMMTLDVAFILGLVVVGSSGLRLIFPQIPFPEKRGMKLSALVAVLIAAPVCTLVYNFVVRDRAPEVSAALRELPPDTVVAGLSDYVDNIPAWTGRQAYAAIELTVPYKKGYYQQTEERFSTVAALLRGPVSPEWNETLAASGIDVFIMDENAPFETRKWTVSFPVLDGLQSDTVFHRHPDAVSSCAIAAQNGVTAIDAQCFAKAVN